MPGEFQKRLQEAFYADHLPAMARLQSGASKLAHYTSAENALNILKSEVFWLRNVKCMNDYSEVSLGVDMLMRVLNKDSHRLLNALGSELDACAPGTNDIVVNVFYDWAHKLPFEVYVGCLAEHGANDHVGLLSMWRAYGGPAGGAALGRIDI